MFIDFPLREVITYVSTLFWRPNNVTCTLKLEHIKNHDSQKALRKHQKVNCLFSISYEGVDPPGRLANLRFCQSFLKNCMKLRKIWVGGASLDPLRFYYIHNKHYTISQFFFLSLKYKKILIDVHPETCVRNYLNHCS